MKLTSFLASSAALATIAIIVPASAPVSWNPIAPAQARTNISFSLFYNDLAPYGSWVSYDDTYVFVPVRTHRHWRPYAEGHWVYTNRYGWMWISEEPFGWATYHYGRWGFAEDIGWYWVPGSRWAPAWVSWRRSGSHIAWAPLPPRHGRGGGDADFTVAFDFDTMPDYYWNVVPVHSFLSINISAVIIDDDHERRRYVREAEFVGNVQVQNNIVVNNVINVTEIEAKTGETVKKVEVKETDNPEAAKTGEAVAFTGKVEGEGDAKPEKITKIEEVKKAKTGEQATGTGEDNGNLATETEAQTGKDKKKLKAEENTKAAVETDTNAEAQTGKDKKKLKAEENTNAAVETDTNAEAQTGKDKKKLKAEENTKAAVETDTNAEAQTGKDKKKLKAEQNTNAAVETDSNAEVQTGKDKKKLKAEENTNAAVETDTSAEVQTGKKKTKDTEALSAEGQSDQQPAQTGKKKKKILEEEPQP